MIACAAVIAAALGACLDIPAPPGGPPIADVDYSIVLGAGGGQYPVQITVEGTDLLAESQTCGDEGGFGVGDLPDFVVDGRGEVIGQLAEDYNGPAVHKVRLDWVHPACDAANPVNGHTTLTWFPDGHIIRFDTMFQNMGGDRLASECEVCPSGDALWHQSVYMAIADVADMQLATGSEITVEDPSPGTDIAGNSLCVTTMARKRISFNWNSDGDPRARTVSPSSTTFAYDILAASPTQDGISTGVIPTTHMMVGTDATACPDMLGRLEKFQESPGDLEINGTVDSTSFEDGIFGSAEEDRYVIDDPEAPITLHAQSEITGGFAVLLVFTNGAPATLTPMGLAQGEYFVQTVSNMERLVWLRAGMHAGDDLVLQPG